MPDRPLVVVSADNVSDPDRWRPASTAGIDRATLLAAFRAVAESVFTCPVDPEKAVRFHYTARDLKIAGAYRNRRGRTIVQIQLDPKKMSCDGPPGDEWSAQLFLLSQTPVHLGSGLQLVDAGDYDADGKSELIFFSSGYDRDGYTMFWNDFKRRADVRWTYH